MNKKIISILIFAALILSMLTPVSAFTSRTYSQETLGTITQCTVDKKFSTVTVAGSIKHSVLVDNNNAKLAVYRFDSWKNVNTLIKTAVPVATADISIRFEFNIPCTTVAQRLSLYAVALIDQDGGVSLISKPEYADLSTANTGNVKFKGVISTDLSSALASNAGTAIVDVVLDSLNNGNKSGYIFNADGDVFYFDRGVINSLDKQILSYTAAGCDVMLRFLISPMASNIPFCCKGTNYIAYKSISVSNAEALRALYAYTYFLASRYDGDDFGRIKGIIMGRGADTPELYNYSESTGTAYAEEYARSIAIVALSALEAQGDGQLSVVVPVGDMLDESGGVYSKSFLDSVASYLADHSNLTFTVMCESRHNPYKITDSMFETDGEDGSDTDTGTDDGDLSQPSADSQTTVADTDYQDVTNESMPQEDSATSDTDFGVSTAPPDETSPGDTEIKAPIINKNSDGFFCTDNIDVFVNMFNRLKKQYASVNNGFAWCWYPSSDSLENALGVCYTYNYLKLSTVSAVDFYTVAFEGVASDSFTSISRMFKYIDTDKRSNETSYAKSVFGIEDWSEIIKGYDSSVGVHAKLLEKSLSYETDLYVGTMNYIDYTQNATVGNWFSGMYCSGVEAYKGDRGSCLRMEFDLHSSGYSYADVGYIFDSAVPLLIGDALSFEIVCGELDGSLYEICVYVYSGESIVVSKGVIEGGVQKTLCVDVTGFNETEGVDSIRIGLKRITGSGKCTLELYKIMLSSLSLDGEELKENFKSIRDSLRAENESSHGVGSEAVILSVISLAVFGVFIMIIAYGSDKRRRDEFNKQ